MSRTPRGGSLPQSLSEWLQWQQQLHPKSIDMGLERSRQVLNRMALVQPPLVVTVAGTNGKGSVVALLTKLFQLGGYRVGSYTSPHLWRYNERIALNGEPVSDSELIAAFNAVEAAREGQPLTYFEFGTLAAFALLVRWRVEVAVLEVGLGGRLDAVNLWDADMAIISAIGLDHTAWLGETETEIAREKAGIMRRDQTVIYGGRAVVEVIEAEASRRGARLWRAGRDYHWQQGHSMWQWQSDNHRFTLPLPALVGEHQLSNAAAVVMLQQRLPVSVSISLSSVIKALRHWSLPARLERRVVQPEGVECLLDVSHNPQAVAALSDWLRRHPASGRQLALLSMLADKDYTTVIKIMLPLIDLWYVTDSEGERGLSGRELERVITAAGGEACYHSDLTTVWRQLRGQLLTTDRLIVFGSFYSVAAVGALIDE
ncbi:bifunctional folylpolyglutamate synthase/dihydrofolate synthase [Ectothiorhodospiraceae bacterium BW-2]|nr:bifunctional folylpolyglutamate synthase/dihydrofolate synthase [Ectothiorhodospiraceae bacterium BW-2]